MNRYAHVTRWMVDQIWAILPSKFLAMQEALAFLAAGGEYSPAEIQAIVGASPRRVEQAQGKIATVPILGTISYRAGILGESSGGTSVEAIRANLREALANPDVQGIILDVDSPGGSVDGIEELAAEIFQARRSKPIVAVADTVAASAAYWLASAASELFVTPSGQVGSIGVFGMHEDVSALQEKLGVRTTVISAGKYKAEALPFEPLSDEARAHMQERVNETYDMFIRAVARNRGVALKAVREGYGEGRLVGAKQAADMGMADGIATLDETVSRMAERLARRRVDTAARAIGGFSLTAGPIPSHKSAGICSRETPWDGPSEVAAADQTELHLLCAWYDSAGPDDDGDGYPDRKGDYKYPHHRHGDHYLVPRGLSECAARIDQSSIPQDQMAGVKRHLAKHYDELGETAPWASVGDGPEVKAEEPPEVKAEEREGMSPEDVRLALDLIRLRV